MVKGNNIFKNVYCINDVIADVDKTTKIWGETKGSATATDRVVILSDINTFKRFDKVDGLDELDFEFVLQSTKLFIE